MPTAASGAQSPLAGLFGRVKRLDPTELYAVAIVIQQQEIAAARAAAGQAGQANAAGSQAAATAASAWTGNPPPAGTPAVSPGRTSAQTATAAPATSASTSSRQASAPATTTRTAAATSSSGAVPIPSSTIAPRKPQDYWNAHIAQFRGKYLPDGPNMRPNCGPASVTMALRMIGLDIPGFSGQNSEAVLDKARIIATGTNNTQVGTTDTELERVIDAAGGRWSESNNFEEILGWVKQGIPVVLSGNPAKGWNHRYSSDQVYPFDGGHWVTVSGYDPKTGYFIVNDPLSQIGPIYVSQRELANYNRAHGGLGIAVFR